jgi:hypothetical protein
MSHFDSDVNELHVKFRFNNWYWKFDCFEPHDQFFSYLEAVTITGDRAANLDQCLALVTFSSEGSFTLHTYCDTGPPFLRSYLKDPWFSLLNPVLLTKEQSLPILNVLSLTRPARAKLKLTTSRMLSESTTTGPLQLIDIESIENSAVVLKCVCYTISTLR